MFLSCYFSMHKFHKIFRNYAKDKYRRTTTLPTTENGLSLPSRARQLSSPLNYLNPKLKL